MKKLRRNKTEEIASQLLLAVTARTTPGGPSYFNFESNLF